MTISDHEEDQEEPMIPAKHQNTTTSTLSMKQNHLDAQEEERKVTAARIERGNIDLDNAQASAAPVLNVQQSNAAADRESSSTNFDCDDPEELQRRAMKPPRQSSGGRQVRYMYMQQAQQVPQVAPSTMPTSTTVISTNDLPQSNASPPQAASSSIPSASSSIPTQVVGAKRQRPRWGPDGDQSSPQPRKRGK